MKVAGRERVRGKTVLALLVLLPMMAGWVGETEAGPAYSLSRKVSCAETAVEVELIFDQNVPGLARGVRRGAHQGRFPDTLRARALATARVVTVLFGAGSDLPKPLAFYLPDARWWEAHRRGKVRAILLLRRLGGQAVVLSGVEGVPSELEAGYGAIRNAVAQIGAWRDRETPDRGFQGAERLLARTSSRGIAELAWDYLCAHEQADAIRRAVAVSRSDSPARSLARVRLAKNDTSRTEASKTDASTTDTSHTSMCGHLPHSCASW